VATVPAAWALYFVSRNSSDDSQPFFTRMIDGYTETAEKWSKRNDLHVRMIEQAGEDRVLFMNTKPHEHVQMKFPEYVCFLPYPFFRKARIRIGGTGLSSLKNDVKLTELQDHERRIAVQCPSWQPSFHGAGH
jgi:hypothetical protein